MSPEELYRIKGEMYAEAPRKDIYDFVGKVTTSNPHVGPVLPPKGSAVADCRARTSIR